MGVDNIKNAKRRKEKRMIKLTFENGDVSFCENEADAHRENGRRGKLGLGLAVKMEYIK